MPDDEREGEPLVDESISEEDDQGASSQDYGGESPSAQAPAPPQDPYHERFSRLEQENAELRTSFQRLAAGQGRVPDGVPQALYKPQAEWTVQDFAQYNQWMMRQELDRLSSEHTTRGVLNEQALGRGHDYDSIISRYVAPLARQNPEIVPFLEQLPAEDRYMLGLMHLVYERSGGNLVNTIRAVTNALGARQAGARDVVRSITGASRSAARRVFGGGSGGRPAGNRPLSSQDVWDMSDEDFRRLEAKATGR
jgi:hypothetical protein